MSRHIESKIQIQCVRWFRLQYPKLSRLLFAVPNGGYRTAVEACVMKSEGVVPGVADLILLVPAGGHSSLCVEMKTASGRQSDNQRQWQADAEMVGNRYVVCRSLDEFVCEVDRYLGEGYEKGKEDSADKEQGKSGGFGKNTKARIRVRI